MTTTPRKILNRRDFTLGGLGRMIEESISRELAYLKSPDPTRAPAHPPLADVLGDALACLRAAREDAA